MAPFMPRRRYSPAVGSVYRVRTPPINEARLNNNKTNLGPEPTCVRARVPSVWRAVQNFPNSRMLHDDARMRYAWAGRGGSPE